MPYLLDPPVEEKGIPPPEEDRVDKRPIRQPVERGGRGWIIWVLGCTLLAVGAYLAAALVRRPRVPQSTTPPSTEEKTPLLVVDSTEKERSVTFAEPDKTVTSLIEGQATVEASSTAEVENDVDVTPKKKSTRRRVRGKKKPKSVSGEEGADDIEEDGSSPGKSEKPLPDLPRQMTAVDLMDTEDKEKLSISDCIIGTFLQLSYSYTGNIG